MRIAENLMSMNTNRVKKTNSKALTTSLERLSSGKKINKAADDVAGMAISEKLRAIILEKQRCMKNVSEGMEAVNVADGGLHRLDDMLKRARELLIQAGSDVNTPDDRKKIENEINQLFDEIDEVTLDTKYNGINMLRWPSNKVEMPTSVTILDRVTLTDEIVEWGFFEHLIVQPEQFFDKSVPAERPAVTLTLDDSVDINDVSTLEGKSFSVSGDTFYFTKTGLELPGMTTIDITLDTNMQTVQNALDAVVGKGGYLSGATVNQDSTVTFTSHVVGKTQVIEPTKLLYYVNNIDGTAYNGIQITSKEDATLKQVDTIDNLTEYAKDAAVSFKLTIQDTYSSGDITQLEGTNLIVGNTELKFTTDSSYVYDPTNPQIKIRDNMTGTEMLQELQTVFDKLGFAVTDGLPAHIAGSGSVDYDLDGELALVDSNGDALSWRILKMAESTPVADSYTDKSIAVPLDLNHKQVSSLEKQDIWEIKIPSMSEIDDGSGNIDYPVTVSIGSRTITFYNSGNTVAGYNLATSSTTTHRIVDVQSSSYSDFQTAFYDTLNKNKSYYFSSDAEVTRDGDTITIDYRAANAKYTITSGSATCDLTFNKNASSMLITGSSYFNRTASFPVDLPSDISDLYGTGFSLVVDLTDNTSVQPSLYTFELCDGVANQTKTSAIPIDISGLTTGEEIRAKIEDVLDQQVIQKETDKGYGIDLSVSLAGGQLTVSFDIRTAASDTPITFIDGAFVEDGLFTNDGETLTAKLDGGTMASRPQTTVDFSEFNSSNLEELVGKGFRICCATCEDEFVNVVFVGPDNINAIPEYYDTQNSLGEDVRIFNYPIDVSKIQSGEGIVNAIINQVTPKLKHFTGVEAGNPASTLVIYDKRMGDIYSGPDLKQGKLITGLGTNFIYEVLSIDNKYESDDIDYNSLKVYVGQSVNDNAMYVDIRIPNLSLYTLHLRPPQLLLNSAGEASKWLGRVDDAANKVVLVQSGFGADYARLNATYNGLASSEITQMDAFSRIFDADMAKEHSEFVKAQIRDQMSTAMLAQANASPENVLQLIG